MISQLHWYLFIEPQIIKLNISLKNRWNTIIPKKMSLVPTGDFNVDLLVISKDKINFYISWNLIYVSYFNMPTRTSLASATTIDNITYFEPINK